MRQHLYRRDGTPYPSGQEGLFEWTKDFENEELRRVRYDTLPDGHEISTVWLGIDHDHWSIFQGLPHVPIIFETMVWDPKGEIIAQQRYRTENDAIVGHVEMVDKLARQEPGERS